MKKVFTIAVCVVFAIVAYSQQIQQITVNATKNVMSVGETMQLTAIISPQEVTNNTLTWSSSNPTIATVNTAGIVTAVSAGSVNIIASANDGSNVTGSFQLVISSVPITSITIGGSTAQMQMGQTIQLSATILPTNATNKSIYWSSLSPNVASVDQTGKVTALSTGTTTIKAMSQDGSGVYAFFDITVISYITIENVVIPLKLYKTTVQSNQFMIDYEVYPQTAPNKNVTWTSTNPQVASVDATGKVKPLSIGTTVIWAISQADITKKRFNSCRSRRSTNSTYFNHYFSKTINISSFFCSI